MPDPDHARDLDNLIRSAIACDVDEAAMARRVRIRVFQTPRRSFVVDAVTTLLVRAPLRVATVVLFAAFTAGLALPQPEQRVEADAWIDLALGDATLPFGPDRLPFPDTTERH